MVLLVFIQPADKVGLRAGRQESLSHLISANSKPLLSASDPRNLVCVLAVKQNVVCWFFFVSFLCFLSIQFVRNAVKATVEPPGGRATTSETFERTLARPQCSILTSENSLIFLNSLKPLVVSVMLQVFLKRTSSGTPDATRCYQMLPDAALSEQTV